MQQISHLAETFMVKRWFLAEENQTNGVFLTNALRLQDGLRCASDDLYFWLAPRYRGQRVSRGRELRRCAPFLYTNAALSQEAGLLPFSSKERFKWKQYIRLVLLNTTKDLSSSFLIMQRAHLVPLNQTGSYAWFTHWDQDSQEQGHCITDALWLTPRQTGQILICYNSV